MVALLYSCIKKGHKPAVHPDTELRQSWLPPVSPSSLSMFGSVPPKQHSSERVIKRVTV